MCQLNLLQFESTKFQFFPFFSIFVFPAKDRMGCKALDDKSNTKYRVKEIYL